MVKSINDPADLGDALFGYGIRYNDIADPTKRLYNGNIGQTLWNSQSPVTGSNPISSVYTYTYDALNRITSATDNTTNYNLDLVEYDKNGNIQRLKRKGHTNVGATTFGLMDDLDYAYDNDNRLLSVTDAVITPALMKGEFKDGNKVGNDYYYDNNGNMVSDLNKYIGTSTVPGIIYNHLNLPVQISIDGSGNNGTISYIYDATGTKLRKIATDIGESSMTTTDYAGASTGSATLVYENGQLQFFGHPEGYVIPDGQGGYDYVYQYRDHLDNIRLSYTDADGNGSINPSTEIIKESHFYPFGMVHKGYNNVVNPVGSSFHKYDYQNQERQDELGLNWLQFKYRMHDPEIGRFISIDPLAEDYVHNSTYAFAENKVIKYNELEGLEITLNKFDRMSYENKSWVGKAATFVGNAGISVANGGIDAFNYAGDMDRADQAAGGFGQGAGTKVAGDASAVGGAISDYAQNTTLSEFGDDVGAALSNVETYEDLAGSILAAGAVSKVSKLGTISKSTNAVDDVVSSGTKRGGRLGNSKTRAQNSAVADELEARGYEITGGGGRLPEEYLPPIGGGRKGGSYPDITATKDGRTLRVNTVDIRKNGNMTTREATNAARIRAQKPNDHLLTIPKQQ